MIIKILSILLVIMGAVSARAEEVPLARMCLGEQKAINVTKAEYEAYSAVVEPSFPTRAEIIAYMDAERQAGRRPNLTVFFWSQGIFRCPYEGEMQRVDLSNLDLSAVDARHLVLYGANEIVLQKSDLRESDWSGTFLVGVDASGANFEKANLESVRFGGQFDGARFREANLRAAVMNDPASWGSSFVGADFTEARLEGVQWGLESLDQSTGLPQEVRKENTQKIEAVEKEHSNVQKAMVLQIWIPSMLCAGLFFMLRQKLSPRPVRHGGKAMQAQGVMGHMDRIFFGRKETRGGIMFVYSLFMILTAAMLVYSFGWLWIDSVQFIFMPLAWMGWFPLVWMIAVPIVWITLCVHIIRLVLDKTPVSGWLLWPVLFQTGCVLIDFLTVFSGV